MKRLIFAIMIWMTASCSTAGMMDADGNVIDKIPELKAAPVQLLQNYNLDDVTQHCDAKGYFIFDSTIYMCVKIRENVTRAELQEYAIADAKVQKARDDARLKWYRDWIKTEEGKAWKIKWSKEYDEKLKNESKGHK